MKLQLDENTLNAYINEAIRQELQIITEKRHTYKVDFQKLGMPKPSVGGAWEQLKGRAGKGVVADMESGKYGSDNTFDDYLNMLIGVGPILNNRNEHLRKKLIGDLRKLGYSDEQISNGLRNGAIQVGNYDRETGDFIPYNEKKQERNLRRISKKSSGIQDYYGDMEGDEKENKKDERKAERERRKAEKEAERERRREERKNRSGSGVIEPEPTDPQKESELPQTEPGQKTEPNPGPEQNGQENQQTSYPWDNVSQEEIDQAKREQQVAREAWLKKQQEKKAAEQAKAQTQGQKPVQVTTQSNPQMQTALQTSTQPQKKILGNLPKATSIPGNSIVQTNKPVGLTPRQVNPNYAQSAVHSMYQTANTSGINPNQARNINARTKQNTYNTLKQAVQNGDITKNQAKTDKAMVRNAEKTLRQGQQ